MIKLHTWVVGLMIGTGIVSQSFAMGRIPKGEYQKKVNELQECSADKDAVRKKNDELSAQVQSLQTKNDQLIKDLESSKSGLQKRLGELMKEKEDVEKQKASEMDKLKSTYDDLVKDMKKEISQGEIQITQLQDKLSVSMVDKIVFNSGESDLNEQGQKVLKRVANILKTVKNKQIRIEGHTDNVPIGEALKDLYPSNWELSTARATSVARYLRDSGGIDPKLLSAVGYGEYRPIAANSTVQGRSKNRRIEIVLVPLEVSFSSAAKP